MMHLNTKITFNNLTIYFLFIALLSGYIKKALIIIFIVLFHELGHAFFAFIFHFPIKKIEVYPFGGMSEIDKLINTPIYKDLFLAFGGIIFQLIIILFIKIFSITNVDLYNYNLYILLFNLIPIIPLDGGKILFYIINYFYPYKKCLKIYPVISCFFIIIYLIINYKYNLNNYLIALLFIMKTYEFFKMRKLYFQKFIIERGLYDLKYFKLEKNLNYDMFKREYDYYDIKDGKIINQKADIKAKLSLK